jgi:hypothetical protein
LLLMGAGIGSAWTHLTPRVMQAAPPGEHDVTSAALSTLQLFATGAGAAVAGLVVNLGGLGTSGTPAGVANLLYGMWIIAPTVAIPLAWRVVRREARAPVPLPAQ